MIIRSDDRQALSRSLAEMAGMGRLEFNNALLTDRDSLLVLLRDRILCANCCVYVFIHHICRRLDLDNGDYSSFNLRRLLTTENAISAFLRKYGITFKITGEAIVPFMNGRRIHLAPNRSSYESNLRKRLLGASRDMDTCVNGFALGDSIQNNTYYPYYAECPELIRMFDHILPSLGLLHDFREQSSTYLISYPVDVANVIIDDFEQARSCDKVEELVRCYLERLFRGFGKNGLINADLGNTILRVGDDVDLSGKGCIIRQYKEGRPLLIQDSLQDM